MSILLITVIVILILLKIFVVLSKGKYKSKRKITGKTVLITGASTGLGYETALDLASRGARIIITARNKKLLNEAKEKIVAQTGNTNVSTKYLDLLSLQCVRDFAEDILKTEERLDILINNAGSIEFGNTISKDSLLCGLQVNHFGPFLLTHLLLGLLKKSAPSRIINVTSLISYFTYLDENNINSNKSSIDLKFLTYSNSKYLMAAATFEMAKRLKDSGVTVNCIHPGLVETDIFKKSGKMAKFVSTMLLTFMKSTKEGAQTIIQVAVSPKYEKLTGKFCMDCTPFFLLPSSSEQKQKKIWDQSVELVQLKPEEMFC